MKPTSAQSITIAKAIGALAGEGIAAEHKVEPKERLDKWVCMKQVGIQVTITFNLDKEGANLESID